MRYCKVTRRRKQRKLKSAEHCPSDRRVAHQAPADIKLANQVGGSNEAREPEETCGGLRDEHGVFVRDLRELCEISKYIGIG